ncbi:DUF2513 domain-containing protein [Bacillus safensis]|uniref:DUF2513 domain-containing protein n=1 Tax=Bacillus safensis TaxID=561879 RepID=UPI003661E5AF
MKRDMDLIREILLYLEADNTPSVWKQIQLDNWELTEVSYHVKLLTEAGLIDGKDAKIEPGYWWLAKSLTNQGHDFLDALKNETVYQKIKGTLGEHFSSIPLKVMSNIAVDITKDWVTQKLGLK